MKSPLPSLLFKFFILLPSLHFCLINAQAAQFKSIAKIVSQVSSTCKASPFECLVTVDKVQTLLPANSPMYFEVLQYKYEALFNLQKIDALYRETEKWINKPELPILFQITNAIYFAKSAMDFGEEARGHQQYQLAKSLLEQMNDQYPSPIRIVQFANLQMVLGQHQDAYQLLTRLAEKYANSPDVHFLLELHGNLGHLANNLNQPKQALIHWLDAIKWAEAYGNKQQIAVVYFNLADTYARIQQYPQAQENFSRSITIALEAGDLAKVNQARYHLVQAFLQQQQYCQAQKVFLEIDSDKLPLNYQLEQLKPSLTARCEQTKDIYSN